jgi:hypothetical protein
MLVPLPADAPETPDWTTVHENEVPSIELERAMAVTVPESMVWSVGVAVAIGATGGTAVSFFLLQEYSNRKRVKMDRAKIFVFIAVGFLYSNNILVKLLLKINHRTITILK